MWNSLFPSFPLVSALLLSNIARASFAPLAASTLPHLPRVEEEDFSIAAGSGGLLSPILIPRVPGTPGSEKVRKHFEEFFAKELPTWNVTTQTSSQTTPLSKGMKVPFVNFVATKDPPWVKQGDVGRYVLVAHYDSKVTPKGFIGATDSAAPCAILLHVARAIDQALSRRWEKMMKDGDHLLQEEEERGVMVLFLDGEEAWLSWNDYDSLYGARDLAQHWEQLYHPPMSSRKNHLGNIDLFILLDLLGSSAPLIPSYFPTTHWAYTAFARLEQQLRDAGLFLSHKANSRPWFHDINKGSNGIWYGGMVQDDHIPFMARGVEVLHLIPSPFPRVWHEMDDDGEHLDLDTVRDWATLTTAWMVGAMGLEEFIVADEKQHVKRGEGRKTEL
ncbi:putative glutaminyl cyclase [Sphaerosporella brunnea]|uniref:Peptide hydrolase n=1 Tax=Sphaerosporella brunnea TaxID=1250544 RepID=A0A5J5EIG4_9PEZI|nr:putative glutaminyl cyclase [Sphaerosporella brunnea]